VIPIADQARNHAERPSTGANAHVPDPASRRQPLILHRKTPTNPVAEASRSTSSGHRSQRDKPYFLNIGGDFSPPMTEIIFRSS